MAEENKIYVGGLALETTSESLRDHFSQFGEITDCIVMVDKVTGRSRCFGFASYKDAGAMNLALGTSHAIDGRDVAAKKAVRENPASAGEGGGNVFNIVKIFVGGLPATCDYDKFTAYFGRFGQIEDAVVMMDNQTQRHRGFGYVTFSDGSAVEAALQNYAGNQIDGKWIEVKRCIPQDKMAPGQTFKGGKGKAFGGRDSFGGGKGKGGYGVVVPPPATQAVAYGNYGMPQYGGGYAQMAYGGAYAGYGGQADPYGAGAYGAAFGAAFGQQRYGGYRPAPY